MKQPISLQTAFGKARFNPFGNRQRGGPARAGGSSKKGWRTSGAVLCAALLLTLFCWTGWQLVKADSSIGNVAAGTFPFAVAVNPVTNKIYVANINSNDVTVIDGTNNSTTTVTTGTGPRAVAVNPVTNKIYVANFNSNNVTVIDGTNNSTTTVAASSAYAVAVNPVTNKIYVANQNSANVTVIDGTNNSTTTVGAGNSPTAVAVNPVTNKIYVTNQFGGSVTVIDGTNNSTTTVVAGAAPGSVAINPATNKIYVVNFFSNNVTVIDGTNNSTTTLAAGTSPIAVAVNPVTNIIYVNNLNSANVTVIDGTNNASTTVTAGTSPIAVAVNPVTNKIYVANQGSNNATVIDGTNNSTTTVAAGSTPAGVAVNPVTNKIYVANRSSNNVTVIDGTNNSTTTVVAGTGPIAVAVNPVTNKIYVANFSSNNVTVIDGTNNATTTFITGTGPRDVAVNPVTNKIYVANKDSANITVIDGTNNFTTTVAAGGNPAGVAVNPVTNKVYVANNVSANVTVIDGTNNSTTTVAAGSGPIAVAVNPVTNKIYVANQFSASVTVIDGTNNSTTTVAAGSFPQAVAVNPVTNKIYVSSLNSNNVTVIDGTNNSTTTVAASSAYAVAVNPVTTKIYVANINNNNVTVIDGTNNSTTTVATGTSPFGVAVNQATNKIYVTNQYSANVTVIDGTNNSTTTVAAGSNPQDVAVNPVTNKIYVTYSNSNVTVITPAPTNAIPLNTTITPLPGNTTTSASPTFTLSATSTYSPNAPPPQNIYFQVDTLINPFLRATEQSRTATTLTANATVPALQPGIHILYFFATDGSDATSINPLADGDNDGAKLFDNQRLGKEGSEPSSAPESSPVIGGINAYVFLVAPAGGGCPTITVNPANPTLPTGQAGAQYNQTFTQTGGNGTTTFTISVGALPNGLSLATGGVLSGAPVAFGNFNFTVKATDSGGCMGTRAYTLTINAPCGTITVNPATLPNGTVGTAYNQTATATGGTAPYLFSVSAGTLPGGLNLFSGGALTGTPNAAGSSSFTIKATDANGCMGTRSYTVTINAAGTGLQFFALAAPVRLLDTRPGASPNACSQPNAPIAGQTSRTQPGRNLCTIPANAAALTGNITTVDSGGGFLTLYPSNAPQPTVASTNYGVNEIINNVFTVGLGADGAFKIFAHTTTDVVVDVTGYYAPPTMGGLFFHPLPAPVRLLETRAGFSGCVIPGVPLTGNTDSTQQAISACTGIPADARAIVGNATTVGPQGGGFLTIFPGDALRPLVAASNFNTGQIVNGPFAVGLAANGQFKIYTTSTTDLVVDVLGYYSTEANDVNGAGLLFTPLAHPVRLLETRPGLPVGCFKPGVPLTGGVETAQGARGVCDGLTIPANALGVVGNATVVFPAGQGFLTLWPSPAARPLVATSNYNTGDIGNRHFIVGLGNADGAFKIYTQATSHLVVDLSGYFAP